MSRTTLLLAVGLLTETEKASLDASPNRKTTIILWLSQLFNHAEVSKRSILLLFSLLLLLLLFRDSHYFSIALSHTWRRKVKDIPLNTRLIVISKIVQMKDFMADLQICIESYPPLSWAQVMQVLVDVYLLFTPVAFVSKMYIDGTEIQIWPLVSTFLVTIFFKGLLGMINLIRNPFGDDVDDFNFDYTLLRAERECISYLGYAAVDPKKQAAEAVAKKKQLEAQKAEEAKDGGTATAKDDESDSDDEYFDPYKHSKSIHVDQFEKLYLAKKNSSNSSFRSKSGSFARMSSSGINSWRSRDAWQDSRDSQRSLDNETTRSASNLLKELGKGKDGVKVTLVDTSD